LLKIFSIFKYLFLVSKNDLKDLEIINIKR